MKIEQFKKGSKKSREQEEAIKAAIEPIVNLMYKTAISVNAEVIDVNFEKQRIIAHVTLKYAGGAPSEVFYGKKYPFKVIEDYYEVVKKNEIN